MENNDIEPLSLGRGVGAITLVLVVTAVAAAIGVTVGPQIEIALSDPDPNATWTFEGLLGALIGVVFGLCVGYALGLFFSVKLRLARSSGQLWAIAGGSLLAGVLLFGSLALLGA